MAAANPVQPSVPEPKTQVQTATARVLSLEEYKREARKRRASVLRKRFIVWTLVAVFAAACLFISAVAAVRIGLVEIKGLSGLYRGPEPVRWVAYQPVAWEQFQATLIGRLAQESRLHEPPYTLPVSESELSGLFVSSMGQTLRDQSLRVGSGQIAVTPNGLDVSLRVSWHTLVYFDLSARLMPRVEPDGKLNFSVADARLGNVSLPADWFLPMCKIFFTRDLGVWEVRVNNQGIRGVELYDRSLNLIIGPLSATSTPGIAPT